MTRAIRGNKSDLQLPYHLAKFLMIVLPQLKCNLFITYFSDCHRASTEIVRKWQGPKCVPNRQITNLTFINIFVINATSLEKLPQFCWIPKCLCSFTVCWAEGMSPLRWQRADAGVVNFPETRYQYWNFPHAMSIA